MTTIRARLCGSSRTLPVGLFIAACLIVPTIDASAGAATPNARISSAARARIARLAAPHIKVVGHKLIWSRAEGVSTYVLARQPVGHASVYRVIAKNSITPKPVPGATVRYRVKTNVFGSAWTHAVTITYTAHGSIVKSSVAGSNPSASDSAGSGAPADSAGAGTGNTSGSDSKSGSGSGSDSAPGSGSGSSSGSGSGSGSGGGSGTGSGGLGGPVEEVASPRTTALKVGLIGVGGWGTGPSETIRKATGVKYTRVNPIEEGGWGPTRELVSEGVTPLVLYDPDMKGMSPEAVAEGVKSFLPIMRELDLSELELGNEVYYHGSTAVEYAAQYRAAHEALAGTGVSLMADLWGDYYTGTEWSQVEAGRGWFVDFCKALDGVPDAWAGHFYGSMTTDAPLGSGKPFGWASVPVMIADLKQAGDYAPLNITEVGQPTYQGTDGNTAVTEAVQAADIKQYLTQAAEWGVSSIYLYEAIDTGEGGYGLYKWPLQAKPSEAVFAETLAKLSAVSPD
jgi:hypothetical protein